MGSEFDAYARNYDEVLKRAVEGFGDADRFAAYKVDEVCYRVRGAAVRRVLDYGCGVGRSLPLLADAFPRAEVWGYDPSAECAEAARRRVPKASIVTDEAEVPRRGFDVVLAANVFHHIPVAARAGALAQCRDALSDAGSLFVFEHNPYNPLTRRVFERCPFDADARMIPRREMIDAGRAGGMQVVRAPFTLFLPFRGRLVAGFHHVVGWLPLGAQYYVQFAR
jgi:SAM-dependent methyltransferase